MRLASWSWGGRPHAGLVSADGAELTPLAVRDPEHGVLELVRALAERVPLPAASGARLPTSAVTLRAPLPRPARNLFGPVRFLIPEGGVSAIDKPGAAFHDPEVNRALFDALTQDFGAGPERKLIRTPHHNQRRGVRRGAGRCVARDRTGGGCGGAQGEQAMSSNRT